MLSYSCALLALTAPLAPLSRVRRASLPLASATPDEPNSSQWAVQDGAAYSVAARASTAEWLTLSNVGACKGGCDQLVPAPQLRALHRATWYLQEHAMVIQRAVQLASLAHEGQARKNGEPFIIHPVETACILAELKMDLDTIVAGLLHDTVEDTDLTLDEIDGLFGPSVAAIVKGDSKQSKLCLDAAALDKEAQRSLNHRCMLMAMGEDWRIVVVKLADRLHNMRTLQHMPRHKQVRIARETIQIFVPLARKLGVETLERELVHLAVQYLFPKELKGLFGLQLLGHWARLQCWGFGQSLDDLIGRDQELSELDLHVKLNGHRQRWLRHVDQWAMASSK
mmetsp:Transcript_17779/g.53653  ORF Transcript_17779/g.53653 Transcript_17779/m.53653 type:complete len:339 (-) Transcript_17779:224-1240(-)